MIAFERKLYPSDLSDGQWELIAELLPAEKKKPRGGRPRAVNMREIVNAILYIGRSGCQWDMLPHDFPAKSTVYEYYSQWRDDGTLQHINDVLVGAIRQLEAPSEDVHPSVACIDSQTVKTSERSGTRGYDGGKKITGRKRHIAVDCLGLLMVVVVTIASMDDAAAAQHLFQEMKPTQQPRLETVYADSKYHNHELNDWLKRQHSIQWTLEIVRRPIGTKGFVLLPKRWVVERTFSWLGRWRRLSRDYEYLERSSEAMIRVASIGRMLRHMSPTAKQNAFNYRENA